MSNAPKRPQANYAHFSINVDKADWYVNDASMGNPVPSAGTALLARSMVEVFKALLDSNARIEALEANQNAEPFAFSLNPDIKGNPHNVSAPAITVEWRKAPGTIEVDSAVLEQLFDLGYVARNDEDPTKGIKSVEVDGITFVRKQTK